MVMHNSVHMAKVTWNFTSKVHHQTAKFLYSKIAKLRCS